MPRVLIRSRSKIPTLVACALAALCAALLLVLIDRQPRTQRKVEASEDRKAIAQPVQINKTNERISAPGQALTELPLTTLRLIPPHQVLDGLTIAHQGIEVRLARLEGPSRDEVCI